MGEHRGEQVVGEPEHEHVEHDPDDDLIDPIFDREHREEHAHERTRDGRGDEADIEIARGRADDRRHECAREQLALDGDVDRSRAFAQHPGERAEAQRERGGHSGREEERDGEAVVVAGDHPHEHREHHREAVTDDDPLGQFAPVEGDPERGEREQQGDRHEQQGRALARHGEVGQLERVSARVGEDEGRFSAGAEQDEQDEPDDGDRRQDDRGSDGEPRLGGFHFFIHIEGGRAHATTSFTGVYPVFGRTKIVRTNPGAAMKSTITAWMTSTMSIGVFAIVCMNGAPARSAPKSNAAHTVPSGRDLPSSATVIASNPMDPAEDSTKVRFVPSTTEAPPSPARTPATPRTHTYTMFTLMPAVRAASGFAPTARNLNPRVERSISHHTPRAASSASTNPRWSRNGSGSNRGSIALSATGGVIGCAAPSRMNWVVSR